MPEELYYMAPIQNAPTIALLGILSFNGIKNHPDLRNVAVSIADPFVNERRHERQIGGRSLHDFVPLYWATHTPMQYVVTQKLPRLAEDDLVSFVLNAARILALPGIWSTDGNAASDDTTTYEGSGALPHLDWHVIATRNCYGREYKRKKCAEVLVPDRVPPGYFTKICVHSPRALQFMVEKISPLRKRINAHCVLPQMTVDRNLYYNVQFFDMKALPHRKDASQ